MRQPNSAGTGVTAVLKVAVTYTYGPYGELLKTTKASGESVGTYNPLVYKDYIWDSETDWYYVQSRYYDPVVGRFINSDSFDVITLSPTALTDKNLYAYCDNNPIDRADDGGEFWHIVAGAAVGGIVEAVSTALDGGNVYEILISLGCGAVAGGVSAACPAASVAINAAMGAVQSVACDLVDGKKDTAIGMVTKATISAGFGALSGSSGPSCLADPTLYKTGKQLRNVAKKGYRPLVRKEAKKAYKALVKNTTKQFRKEMVETGAYKSIEWYTKKRVETLYKKIG